MGDPRVLPPSVGEGNSDDRKRRSVRVFGPRSSISPLGIGFSEARPTSAEHVPAAVVESGRNHGIFRRRSRPADDFPGRPAFFEGELR